MVTQSSPPVSTHADVASGNGWAANGTDGITRQFRSTVRDEQAQRLARALGWLSIGLGVAAIAGPHRVAHALGLPHDARHTMLRAIGVREIASGVGILTQQNPTNWLWGRVSGDALDLALLTKAMGNDGADRGRLATATAAVIGMTAVDALAGLQLSQDQNGSTPEVAPAPAQNPRVASAITVRAPVEDVFAAWERFQRLPSFMESFATVSVSDGTHSQWQAPLPGGLAVSWDAVITATVPNERIVWRTKDESKLTGFGHVQFRAAPGAQGTEVLFDATFSPPGGELGSKIAGLFTDALGVKLNNDLRRFKQLIELGEIVRSDDSAVKGPNPAQPVGRNAAG